MIRRELTLTSIEDNKDIFFSRPNLSVLVLLAACSHDWGLCGLYPRGRLYCRSRIPRVHGSLHNRSCRGGRQTPSQLEIEFLISWLTGDMPPGSAVAKADDRPDLTTLSWYATANT
jgi:hypothetical protein